MSILDLIYPTDPFPKSIFGPAQPAPYVPNPRKHFVISMVKSAVRILACLFFFHQFPISASLLLVAELIGIIEEMV